ncbi:hypothetical protein AAG570_000823 [Ranatra chinensis]|uniref:Uncharacterized protein n=1 Tax=Ranatra chinensis TaxID=642074 RepID=A0ABD0YY73_9HEMI
MKSIRYVSSYARIMYKYLDDVLKGHAQDDSKEEKDGTGQFGPVDVMDASCGSHSALSLVTWTGADKDKRDGVTHWSDLMAPDWKKLGSSAGVSFLAKGGNTGDSGAAREDSRHKGRERRMLSS